MAPEEMSSVARRPRPTAGACFAWIQQTGPAICRASRRSTSRSASRDRAESEVPRSPSSTPGSRELRRRMRRAPLHRWSVAPMRTYLESLLDPCGYRGILTTTVVNLELRSDVQTGQRRGRWTGVPLESRLALRRDNLINAGVQLLGSAGGPALTVRAVCREAALTERYFYESFADRDEFVRAVYDDVCTRAMNA